MEKIINFSQATNLAQKLRSTGKTIVLVGGCFDLLHPGHIKFLEKAKKEGDVLVVALENDETVKRLKGGNRPINPQGARAQILSALKMVDCVILLPFMKDHADYFSLVENLKPDVIAVTAGDPQHEQKRKQAKMVGGKLKVVISRLKENSTSRLVKILGID